MPGSGWVQTTVKGEYPWPKAHESQQQEGVKLGRRKPSRAEKADPAPNAVEEKRAAAHGRAQGSLSFPTPSSDLSVLLQARLPAGFSSPMRLKRLPGC
jgi:hypothetical protein